MSLSSPLLTIGLPVYNAAPYLPLTLGSIFAQTFTDWELLLVDDGSTDDGAEILRSMQGGRVRLLEGGKNLGLAARLNQIVREARGTYIARMDADDMMLPSRLELQVRFLEENRGVDCVGSGLLAMDNSDKPTGMRVPPATHEAICADPLHGIRMIHATVVATAEWLRAHPYNEGNRTCEDWELWFSSYRESRFANLQRPLYLYREFASYTLPGYLRAKQQVAALQWRRRSDFGTGPVLADLANHLLRAGYNIACCAMGHRDHLVRRRSQPLNDEARRLAAEALPAIHRSAVALFPNLDLPARASLPAGKREVTVG